ncbi:hypothetical protein [Chryseobacterium sp. JV558]|uniref:hypothetical protein n=1 Tax=Chryseobacterium sp. JV558 TaxID=2663236 RepID=UPI00299DC863|nr:hypothetical protein [Chryseobacterium sp. JV558]MDW9380160.1 hypothetical protein [Chryseobacterium sp. JV558]
MLKKTILIVCSVCAISCATNNNRNEFNNYLLSDKLTIHFLEQYANNNKVNISDPKDFIKNRKEISYTIDNTKVSIVSKNELADFILVEYVLNKDLAFLAFLKKGENKVICFLFNKGKHKGQWMLIEKFEKSNV